MTPLAPTAVYRTWFPALVVLPAPVQVPGGLQVDRFNKAKVFATDAGLLVYVQGALPDPVFQSPILLDKTPEPGTDYASQQRGHVIITEAGTVTVTKLNACSTCGLARLFNFRPAWSLAERTWGA